MVEDWKNIEGELVVLNTQSDNELQKGSFKLEKKRHSEENRREDTEENDHAVQKSALSETEIRQYLRQREHQEGLAGIDDQDPSDCEEGGQNLLVDQPVEAEDALVERQIEYVDDVHEGFDVDWAFRLVGQA